jgi:hypothetical protein
MIIANPIYDVVFKRLMENEKAAKFFIGTLLEQDVLSVQVQPQEYTYKGELETAKGVMQAEERIRERFSIWVYRLDFVATVRTQTGEYKKILIEIQKAKNPIDLMRFRNYLAEQYKREDKVNNEKVVLPITTIYILGFTLPDIESSCISVKRDYIDLIAKTKLPQKSEFVEKLTHDSFVIQVQRITDRYQTRLDKLLSIFEQRHFTDEKEITKDFTHLPDLDEVKNITDILHYVGTDPKERKQIEMEQEARRTVDAMFENYRIELATQKKALMEKDQALNEKDQALNEKDQALNEKDQALSEKDRLIAELMRKLNEQQP